MHNPLSSEELLTRDSVLRDICRRVANEVPGAKSIILSGSRALGTHLNDPLLKSDYDMAVVMSTIGTFLHIGKLKRIERELSAAHNVDMSLNPLPTFRLDRAQGNFLLFKYGREAVTLQGDDYLSSLKEIQPGDIGPDWYFLRLSGLMRDLAAVFDPAWRTDFPSRDEARLISYRAAKTLTGCVELHLLRRGIYHSTPEEMAIDLDDVDETGDAQGADHQLGEDLRVALRLKASNFVCDDPVELWSRARDRAVEAFKTFVFCFGPRTAESLVPLVAASVKMKLHKRYARNMQYFLSTLLLRKELFWKVLVSGPSMDSRMRAALVLLLAGAGEGSNIDDSLLNEAYKVLGGHVRVERADSSEDRWRALRAAVVTYYPHACRSLGV